MDHYCMIASHQKQQQRLYHDSRCLMSDELCILALRLLGPTLIRDIGASIIQLVFSSFDERAQQSKSEKRLEDFELKET